MFAAAIVMTIATAPSDTASFPKVRQCGKVAVMQV